MRRLLSLVFLTAALSTAGCDTLGIGDNGLDELRENRAKWRAQAVASYSYVQERGCFCGMEVASPVRIVVVNSVRSSATYVSNGQPVSPNFSAHFGTIDQLFEELERAVKTADAITIRYDKAMGYPVSASIDYQENAIDDELTLSISGFTRN